jgi:tetratricopeptide (TPR) repeat protein
MLRLLASTSLAACLSLAFVSSAQTATDFDSLSAAAGEARASDPAKAAELYAQAVALRPDWSEGWWFLGVLNYGADRYAPAVDAFSHYLAMNPNGGPALALRGLCEFETGQYRESLQDIQSGMALGAADNPRNGRIVRYHEALLLTRLGSFDQAIGRYLGLVKSGAPDPEMTSAIGLAGLRMQLLPSEIDAAKAELVAATGRAAVEMISGDGSAGKKSFGEVFERFPGVPNAHYFYGYLLLSTDPDEAVNEFRKELAVSPASANVHAMLAWTLGLHGHYAESLPDAQKAVAEEPSLPMAQMVLGRALVETGAVESGLPHLEQVLQAEPSNLEAHLTLAKAYSNLGRNDDARRERLTCLQLSGMGGSGDAGR